MDGGNGIGSEVGIVSDTDDQPTNTSDVAASGGDSVVRCRGLPWSCTEDDIKQFFGPAGAHVTEVHFTLNREGRPSGEAYIAFADENSYQTALGKDRDNMGHRYIEVFASKRSEMEHVTGMRGGKATNGAGGGGGGAVSAVGNDDGIVRLRGLPFGCTKEEIANFFLGLQIAPNGIVLPFDQRTGKSTGESYVCFIDKSTSEKALEKHMHNIQHRYIEVFRSSQSELERTMRALTQGGGGGGGGPMWDGGGAHRSRPYDRPNGGAGNYYSAPQQHHYAPQQQRPPPMYGGMMGDGYGGGAAANGYGSGAGGYGGAEYDGYGGYGGGGGGMYGHGEADYYGRAAGGGPIRAVPGGRPTRRPYGAPPSGAGGHMPPQSSAGGSQHVIKMRGLPYRATDRDIAEFFAPIRIAKINLLTEYGSGRPSGEARVEFFTYSDLAEGLKRDRAHMGTRYVELFAETAGGPSQAQMPTYPDYSRDVGY